jgi:uncharacterized protein (TIGR00725 family)
MKIAILSSASKIIAEENKLRAVQIANHLGKIHNIEVMTGGSCGLPGLIVEKAKNLGLKTTCYSPDENKDHHALRDDNQDLSYFDEVSHHKGFTLRSLMMVHDADGVLVLNGRMGTLSEFTIALEEGKRVGVITNTGGIADELKHIVELSKKDFSEKVFFSDDPIKVIDWLTSS